MKQSYCGFILDADNTLLDFNRAEKAALREALRLSGFRDLPEDTASRYHRINVELWRLFELGKISQDALRTERFRRLLASLDVDGQRGGQDPIPRIAERYVQVLSMKSFLLPHALRVLRVLAARTAVVLLTNGLAAVQRRRIQRCGIGGYFREILISEELGLAKPDPRIFDLACERLGVERRQTLCVGDSPSSDIRGGSAAGIDTCWYSASGADYPPAETEPLYRIRDLRQLLDFLPAAQA